jgi:hypothetical protein
MYSTGCLRIIARSEELIVPKLASKHCPHRGGRRKERWGGTIGSNFVTTKLPAFGLYHFHHSSCTGRLRQLECLLLFLTPFTCDTIFEHLACMATVQYLRCCKGLLFHARSLSSSWIHSRPQLLLFAVGSLGVGVVRFPYYCS